MPSRPDLRELASNVKEAFGDLDRETLVDILTFVVKEYVVEGPPPMLIHQAETLADLKNASFAQIILALQTRFDHPELQMFAVDGDQVSVRIGGVMHPLLASRQPMAPAAADLPRPAAGVRVVETTLQQRPPQAAPAAAPQPASAPPPARGLSVRGRPQGEGEAPAARPAAAPPPAAAAGQQPPAAPPAAAPAAPAAKEGEKPEAGGDDASARFSLLELD